MWFSVLSQWLRVESKKKRLVSLCVSMTYPFYMIQLSLWPTYDITCIYCCDIESVLTKIVKLQMVAMYPLYKPTHIVASMYIYLLSTPLLTSLKFPKRPVSMLCTGLNTLYPMSIPNMSLFTTTCIHTKG